MKQIACPKCKQEDLVKSGVVKGRQRYRCRNCNYFFTVLKSGKNIDPYYVIKALQLYMQSARRGDVIAAPGMVSAGRLFEKGLGVARDITLAKVYYIQALSTGYQAAQQDLLRIQNVK